MSDVSWNTYRDYWNGHAGNVGPEHAVTGMEQEEYTQYFAEFLPDFAPEHVDTILDIGCGAGMVIPLVQATWPDAHYVGVDVSDVLIARCKEKYPELAFALIGSTITLPPSDFIFMHSVLTHITQADAEIYLDLVRETLTPGGRASLSIHINPPARLLVAGDTGRMDYAPLYFEGLLERHGLKIYGHFDGIQRWYCVGRAE